MNMTERNKLRKLQDRVLAKVRRLGKLNDLDQITEEVRVKDLEMFLYPEFENDFLEFLREG